MSNVQKLQKVFDTQSLTGKLVQMNEEQANAFIDFMVDESKLMSSVRLIRMQKPLKTIAKLFANGRFLKPGVSGSALSDADAQKASTETIELQSKLVRGKIFVTDEELEDNIEGSSFKETFLRLVARKAANEIEEIAIYARKVSGTALSTLDQFDGFKYRVLTNGNVVDASDTNTFSDRFVAKEKFAKAMKSTKTKYRQGLSYFAASDVLIDYGLLFDTIADSAVRASLQSSILGKSIVEIPLMRVDEPVKTATATTVDGAHTANGTLAVIDAADATGFTAGKYITVAHGTNAEQNYQIVSVSTNAITVDRPIDYDIAADATLHVVTRDGADAMLTNPLNLIYGIQTGGGAISFETERVASVGYYYHFKMRMDFQVENPEATTLITNLEIK